jgi:2'-hydroxyisoflavone reductase
MRILILGGTIFLGRHLSCGYVPRVVHQSARLLADAVGRHVFVSSISVYPRFAAPGLDERGPVGTLADPSVEEVNGETYGPLKALCEQEVEAALPGRPLTVRPGLIVGPHDPSDRFTYWPRRIAQGGEILAPGNPEGRVQLIDARDLAEWMIHSVEAGQTGVFNATGPAGVLTMRQILEECCAVSAAAAALCWVEEAFPLDAGVAPWSELPLWMPERDETFRRLGAVSIAKAIAAGLTFRPLAGTIRDALAWDATLPPDRELRAGLKPSREAELLAAWKARA